MTDLRQAAQQALDAIHLWHWAGETHLLMAAHDALRTSLAQEHALHDLARLGQEIEQAEPISTNAAMRDARLNAGWGSEQQAKPPPEWPLVKNILDEYGLQAISFVADWKAAQRPWVGLTEEDWGWVADRKGTSLDTFDQGAAWAANRLKERNNE